MDLPSRRLPIFGPTRTAVTNAIGGGPPSGTSQTNSSDSLDLPPIPTGTARFAFGAASGGAGGPPLPLTAAQLYSYMSMGSYGAGDRGAFATTAASNNAFARASGGGDHSAASGGQPRYRSKAVCKLDCKYCGTPVCNRAMKAVLLADAGIELFSTDCPPKSVGLFGDDYTTEKCQCRIRDVACMTCGNQVGYHVTQPCKSCLDACNNGHMHMYHSEHIKSSERVEGSTGRPVVWATLPPPDKDVDSIQRKQEQVWR
ncbi:FAM72 protein-domain-containing protein [Blastocladiella britannica]|nr:FAM72 protein-domain-containing protein [Blastocladiella britannica]